MTWPWILLALVGVVLCALLGVLVTLLRRQGALPAAPLEVPVPAPVSPAEVQARVEEAVAAERRALAAERERLGQDRARQQAREAELEQAREEAERATATARLAGDAAARLRESAGDEAARLRENAGEEAARLRESTEQWAAQERADLRALGATLESRELRLGEREERLVAEGRQVELRGAQLDRLRSEAQHEHDELVAERQQVRDEQARAQGRLDEELQRVAGLDQAQARTELMARVEHESRLEATALARGIEQNATREAEGRARRIVVTAIQRLAAEQTSESVVSTLDLPSDEMKGRIIGREGRNIRHFEQVTGVNVMIDDTPGSVLVSCFDPVRREVARLTLAELVADGRIHPARIEEVYERSRARIEERCLRAAEDALAEVGISDLDPELVPVLGALRYRTSYGQNVLRHLVECAHLAGMMAAELGLDVAVCKRAAFLHDIGKALTHEVEGSHAIVGAELARRHGESPDVVHAIEAHHNEVEPTTVEAILTQAADAISGSRPGARRESLEAYVHRLERLEQIAAAHEGVDKVFAMQAGREVRVMVSPDHLDDAAAHALARDIAHEIQSELTYPGQIRVTVVRESRATEIAH